MLLQLIALLGIMATAGDTLAQTAVPTRGDSLQNELIQTVGFAKRAQLLTEICTFYYESGIEQRFAEQLYEEAKAVGAISYMEQALAILVRYDYNLLQVNSMNYWMGKLEQLVKETQVYSPSYFVSKSLVINMKIWKKQMTSGLEDAIALLEKAVEVDSKEGLVEAYTNMAYIYLNVAKNKKSLEMYKKALHLSESIDYDMDSWKLHAYNYIILNEIELKHFDHALRDIQIYKTLALGRNREEFYENDASKQLYLLLINTYRLKLYLGMGKYEAATTLYKKMNHWENNWESTWGIYATMQLKDVYSAYLCNKGDYEQALLLVEEGLRFDENDFSFLSRKGHILNKLKRYKEANEIHKKIIQLKIAEEKSSFDQQLEAIEHSHKVNAQLRIMQEKERRIDKIHLYIAIGVGTILTILLLIFLFYNKKLRGMGKLLRKEKRHLEQTQHMLHLSKEKAEESDRLKSLFLANMSHEIRTPLNAIVGFSSIIANREGEEEEYGTYTGLIEDNAQLLLNLINDILDISKLEAHKYQFTFKPTQLDHCCQQVVMSLRNRVPSGVKLYFKEQEQKGLLLTTDHLRLQQVLINLITNAIKFTQKGSICLEYAVNKEKQEVIFAVTDTGVGIPKEKQALVFQRFEKLNDFAQGTGLGLSISQLIVEQFKGKIYIDKHYTAGARFIFTHAMTITPTKK